jgi:cell wall integrity and stress response component
VMMQRRMSDGSIADNQDYSRRILKVTNPDGS